MSDGVRASTPFQGLAFLALCRSTPGDQPAEVRVDRAVTFAVTVLQSLDIDVDAATPIVDQSRLLQLAGDQGDAAALHPQHLGQEFLRQRQRIAAERRCD